MGNGIPQYICFLKKTIDLLSCLILPVMALICSSEWLIKSLQVMSFFVCSSLLTLWLDMSILLAMEAADFTKTYAEIFAERTRLLSHRTDLETDLSETNNKIAHLSEVLTHLNPLTDNPHASNEIAGLGITDAIRTVLKFGSEKLTAKEILQRLTDNGYDFSTLSAPMSSIYKILSRLTESGEVVREREESRLYYSWNWPTVSDEDIPF